RERPWLPFAGTRTCIIGGTDRVRAALAATLESRDSARWNRWVCRCYFVYYRAPDRAGLQRAVGARRHHRMACHLLNIVIVSTDRTGDVRPEPNGDLELRCVYPARLGSGG